MKRIFGTIVVGALWTSLVFSAVTSNAVERTIQPELILNQIKLIKTQKAHGDRLYLTLSARVGNKPTEYIRIPVKPEHWLSGKIDAVQKIHLWSGPLVEGQAVTIIVELNDQNTWAELEPDDLLGVMRVKLKNEKGSLLSLWDIPNQSGVNAPKKLAGDAPDTHTPEPKHVHKFDLQNDGAHYEVHMSMSK